MKIQLASLLLAFSLPATGTAAVISGTSSARDLSATATVTGSLLGAAVAQVNVSAGPINQASGTAPVPYNSDPALLTAAASAAGVLVPTSLTLGVNTLDLTATSNVDGGEGARFGNATGLITSASAGLNLNLGGVLGNLNLLQVTAGNGTTTFTSNAAVNYDGLTLSPSSSTNFLSSGTGVSVVVLGSTINLSGLAAGSTSTFGVNVTTGSVLDGNLVNVTGTISVTPDLFNVTGLSLTSASANATSLRILANLNLSAAGGLTNLNVTDEILINQTSTTLTAVPEPDSVVLGLLAGMALLGLTHRRSACL